MFFACLKHAWHKLKRHIVQALDLVNLQWVTSLEVCETACGVNFQEPLPLKPLAFACTAHPKKIPLSNFLFSRYPWCMQARSTKTSAFDLQKSNVKSAAKRPKTWAQGLKRYLEACCFPSQFEQKNWKHPGVFSVIQQYINSKKLNDYL